MENEKKTQFSGILVCCVGFFFLFVSFLTMQGRATTIFKDIGFHNLGTYIVAVIYIGFGLSTFVSPSIVIALKYRCSLVISSSFYTAFTFVCMIPAARDKYGLTTGLHPFTFSVASSLFFSDSQPPSFGQPRAPTSQSFLILSNSASQCLLCEYSCQLPLSSARSSLPSLTQDPSSSSSSWGASHWSQT